VIAVTARLPHNLRSDARDNRDRILDATRSAVVTHGLDVPIREIARRAEVGPATVYRHFPTKEMLFAAAFTHQMLAWRSVLDEGLSDPDPWHGFCVTIEKLCELQARDRGFIATFKAGFPRAMDFDANRSSSLASGAELIRRAKGTGRLRPDAFLNDLILVIMANDGIRTSTPSAGIADSRRFAALMIQAFQASPAPSSLPPVPQLTPAVPVPRRRPPRG
jgi:AcrR family transcriptional regulator